MKFAGVFPEKERSEEAKFYLRLVSDGPNSVRVIACDETGEKLCAGSILSISPLGFRRFACIDPIFGFNLDSDGCLMEEEN